VATYIIRELVENPELNRDILDKVNHHFLPVANPDGYVFSHTHDDVCMMNLGLGWVFSHFLLTSYFFRTACGAKPVPTLGMSHAKELTATGITRTDGEVDFVLKKNIPQNHAHIIAHLESGVNHAMKCSDIYPGEAAFSEVENEHIRDYVLSLDPVPTYANAFHSYGKLILYPYGYAVQ
jgi:hypothetical protein